MNSQVNGQPGRRVSRRQLVELSARLTMADMDTLGLIAEHRFLTTRHVAGLVHSDSVSRLAAVRAAQRALRKLQGEALVARLPRRVGVWGGGAAGGVWRLTEAGHRLRRLPVEPHPQETNNGTSNRRARFTEPSPQFLAHTLRVADIRLALEQLTVASEGRVELTTVQTEPTCWRSWTGPYGAPATLRPDLYAETTSGDYLDCWFIEADMGTEHLTAIVKKARAYQAYWRSGREQAALGVFPLVVWVTPDERRAQAIAGAVAGDTGCDNRLHRAAPFERLVEAVTGHVGTADKTLKTPIEGSQS